MCDYSLHDVASRAAMVGDKLITTKFSNSSTRGFAATGEPNVAVCLLPGREVAFEKEVEVQSCLWPPPAELAVRETWGEGGSVPADQHGSVERASRCSGVP